MEILKLAAERRQWVIDLRRQFHMYPEPGWEEHDTSAAIAAALDSLNIPFKRIAPTGIIADLEGGRPGRTVALRADMDALPLTEKNSHAYVSRNPGFCHACGHDAHMAMLLGAAGILAEVKNHLRGSIRLIFQPAEEIFGGAGTIIDAGGLNGVDSIFGMHILGRLPAGRAAVSPGAVMAAANHFTITVTGRSGHGGLPHQGVDALLAASAIVIHLQSIVSREIDPLDTAVVSIGRLSAGTAYNIIAGSAWMEGTTRCFTETMSSRLAKKIERVASNTARAYNTHAELAYAPSVPPTVNDPECAELAANTIDTLCGPENREQMTPLTGAEDFAFYLRKVPGVFVFLGGGNASRGLAYPQHHESFDIDEAALEVGAALYAQYAIDFLNQG